MILMALDLEMNQPSNKIIQVGWAVGDLTDGAILSSGSLYVNPNEELNPVITELTGITQDNVDAGNTLEDVYSILYCEHVHWGCFINPLTWGSGDAELLREQLGDMKRWIFGRRWIDVKTVWIAHQMARGANFKGGLKRTMNKIKGLGFAGQAHDAEVDAYNTFRMYRYLLGEMRKASQADGGSPPSQPKN